MTAADREGLREALAQALYAHDESIRNRLAPMPWASEIEARRRPYRARANAAMATPELATLLAQADSAEQAAAERDEAQAKCERLRAELATAVIEIGNQARARGEAEGALRVSELAGVVDSWRDHANAAQAEVARLTAEVERLRAERDEALSHLPEGLRDTSLAGAVQALAFSASTENASKWRWGHALTIGLAFADKAAGEEWEHGGMASIDVCLAMGAILGCDCDSDEWRGMVKAGEARVAEHLAATTHGTDAPAAEREGTR